MNNLLKNLLSVSLFIIAQSTFGQAVTYDLTLGPQTYTVPVDVYSVNIKCWGAQGNSGGGVLGGAGGLGAYTEGDLIVSPGDVLNIFVGGQAGYNGGGEPGPLDAGHGGGASDIRYGGLDLGDRVLVAGGGGGGGSTGCTSDFAGGDGGSGGGGAGGNGENSEAGGGGFGGTVGVGGDPGLGCLLGGPGLDDGTGGSGNPGGCFTTPGGGGGGGGYVVGGGGGGGSQGTVMCLGDSKGGGGGGAGGSSYADEDQLIDVAFELGVRLGDGQIIIEPNDCEPITVTATDYTVCFGDSFTVSSEALGDITWTGGLEEDIPFTPGELGDAVFIGTSDDEGECGFVLTIEVIDGVPTLIESDFTEVCIGDPIVFTASGADEYSWDPDDVVDGESYYPELGTTVITLVGVDLVSGCEGTTDIEVVAYEVPDVTTSGSESSICLGDMVTFTSDGADEYEWDPVDIEDGEPYTPTESGVLTYTVTGIVGTDDGCSNTAEVEINVLALPEVMATATDSDICLGESLTLTAEGALTYVWDPEVEDGIEFTPETTGSFLYTLQGTAADGCVNDDEIEINVYEPLEISYTITEEDMGGDGEIDITVTGGNPPYIFDWDFDGTGDFDDLEDLTDLSAGIYTIVVNCTAGCSITEIINFGGVGINELNGLEIDLFPNPAKEFVRITYAGDFHYELTSINGANLITGNGNNSKAVSLANLSNGMYLLNVYSEGQVATMKLIKE